MRPGGGEVARRPEPACRKQGAEHIAVQHAAGIDATGHLGPLEVLAYRESHGGEIRNEAWRRQFAGREGLGQLRVRADIKNIAGATLSCEHVTEGVRWLVALWQVALGPRTAASAA